MATVVQRTIRAARRLLATPRRTVTFNANRRRCSDGPPIFIVGCPRSGTTLVRKILNGHSRIACPGETSFLCGMLDQLQSPRYVRGLETIDVYRDEVAANIRSLALHYFEGYLYRVGKARWADKTPGYTRYMPELYEVLGPEICFVHVLRHGMDCAWSIFHCPWFLAYATEHELTDRQKIRAAGRMWLGYNAIADAFIAQHPEICHRVRYETLTESPERVVRDITDFLGERFEPAMLDYQSWPHTGSGDPKTHAYTGIVPTPHRYPQMPQPLEEVLYEQLADRLEQYGYTVDSQTMQETAP